MGTEVGAVEVMGVVEVVEGCGGGLVWFCGLCGCAIESVGLVGVGGGGVDGLVLGLHCGEGRLTLETSSVVSRGSNFELTHGT